jgi:hypothetical protein
MKPIIVFALSFMTVNYCLAQLVNLKPEKLTWKYYKAKGPVTKGRHTATTNFTFVLTLENPNIYNVKSDSKVWHIAVFFICDSSWVDKEYLKTLSKTDADSLFHHELFHYLIGILNAKKCQYELNHSLLKTKTDTFEIYRKYEIVCYNMTNNYDIETNGGLDHKKQQDWETYINKNINSLNDTKLMWGLANRSR